LSTERIKFPCGDITLEGEWHLPAGEGPFPGIVVCHPHPLYGGDMDNNVVVAICRELSRNSVAAFRFNFRGVGGSGGEYGGGVGEQGDVSAALDFVLATMAIDAGKIGLAGYSFGGGVVLSVALQDERVGLLALVSPMISDGNWEKLKEYRQGKLIIVGGADSFISAEQFQQRIDSIADPKEYRVVSEADHSWWGHERELTQQVSGFFVSGFNRSQS